MTLSPRWAIATIPATKAGLIKMISEMPDAPEAREAINRTNAEMRAYIEAQRRAYWDDLAKEKAAAKPANTARGGFSGLTASEVNAWLQTLPPVPLWGA